MLLTNPEHETVLHVARHMRGIDREEIYGIRDHENPFLITNEVMAAANFAWVAWHDGWPAIVIGGRENWHGRWSMFCFGTDSFPALGLPLTRFVKSHLLPTLFDELGAKRLEADSHWRHVEAHRWLESFGAHQESVKRAYGKNGDDYFCFAFV